MDPRPELKRVIKARRTKPQSLYLETWKEPTSNRNKSYSKPKRIIDPHPDFFDTTNRSKKQKSNKKTHLQSKTLPKGAFKNKTVAGRRNRQEARSKAHFSLRKIGEAPSRSEWFKGKRIRGKSKGSRPRGASSFMLGFQKLNPNMPRNLSTNHGCVTNLHSLHQVPHPQPEIAPHLKPHKKRAGKKSLNSIKQRLKLTAESGAQSGDRKKINSIMVDMIKAPVRQKSKSKTNRENRTLHNQSKLKKALDQSYSKHQSFTKEHRKKLSRGVLACFQKSPKTRGNRKKHDLTINSPQSLNSMTLVSQKIANTSEMRTWVAKLDEKISLHPRNPFPWEDLQQDQAILNIISQNNFATHQPENPKPQLNPIPKIETKPQKASPMIQLPKHSPQFPGLKKITRLKSARIKSEFQKFSHERRSHTRQTPKNKKPKQTKKNSHKKPPSTKKVASKERRRRKCSSTHLKPQQPTSKDPFPQLNYFTPHPKHKNQLFQPQKDPMQKLPRDQKKIKKKKNLKINYFWDGKGFKTTKTAKTAKAIGKVKLVKLFATKSNNQTQTKTHKKTAKLWDIFQKEFAFHKKDTLQSKERPKKTQKPAKQPTDRKSVV